MELDPHTGVSLEKLVVPFVTMLKTITVQVVAAVLLAGPHADAKGGEPTMTPNAESYQMTFEALIAAESVDDAVRLFAHDYRMYFHKKEGDGMSRDQVARLLEWDYALNPRYYYRDVVVDGNTLTAQIYERNDFSRLIDFPGWEARLTLRFDTDGKIVEQLYVPNQPELDYNAWLAAPLTWIREHHPEALDGIYKDGHLVTSAASATKWVELLRLWRAATGRPGLKD